MVKYEISNKITGEFICHVDATSAKCLKLHRYVATDPLHIISVFKYDSTLHYVTSLITDGSSLFTFLYTDIHADTGSLSGDISLSTSFWNKYINTPNYLITTTKTLKGNGHTIRSENPITTEGKPVSMINIGGATPRGAMIPFVLQDVSFEKIGAWGYNITIINCSGSTHVLNVSGCTFTNTLTSHIITIDSSPLLIKNTIIDGQDNSSATIGVAILARSSNPQWSSYSDIGNCTFSNYKNNIKDTSGGVISVGVGGIKLSSSYNKFMNNSSQGSGGAIYSKGVVTITSDKLTFKNNTSVGDGGAIYSEEIININGCLDVSFTNNTSLTGGGGAIYSAADCTIIAPTSDADGEQSTTISMVFDSNRAHKKGGAISTKELTIGSQVVSNMGIQFIDNSSSEVSGQHISTNTLYWLTTPGTVNFTNPPCNPSGTAVWVPAGNACPPMAYHCIENSCQLVQKTGLTKSVCELACGHATP